MGRSVCVFVKLFSGAIATSFGIVVWLLSYLIISLPMDNATYVSFYCKLASCLLPNVGLHWAVQIMFAFETRGEAIVIV